MRKKRKIEAIVLGIILALIILILLSVLPRLVGYITKVPVKQIEFYFYDENTNCSLDGYVFSGNEVIGGVQEGYFNLTYENYLQNFNIQENISLFGRLGSCFQENSEFLFDKYWRAFEIEDYYFKGDSLFKFKTSINPNNPARRELMGFIQPGKVYSGLANVELTEDTLEDLSKINQYLNSKINYTKDWDFRNRTNYWQTPLETLERGQGDCEDFSAALLSLFLAYNSSLNCYNIVFSSHVTTFCKIEDYYIYYDQGKTELKKQISTTSMKAELKNLKEEYFEYYGINDSERAYYAFNDNSFIEFISEDGLIDWQASLQKKQDKSIFERLDAQLSNINITEQPEEMELRTSSVSEAKTLKGFFQENYKILILLAAIAVILIVVLVKLRKKGIKNSLSIRR